MNYNSIIAVLVIKGIMSREEGEKLVEHINNEPQSTDLGDAVERLELFISNAAGQVPDTTRKIAGDAVKSAAPAE